MDFSVLDSAIMTRPIVTGAAILFAALKAFSQTTATLVMEVASIKEMSRRDFRDAGLSGVSTGIIEDFRQSDFDHQRHRLHVDSNRVRAGGI
jgi:hypothetical protein